MTPRLHTAAGKGDHEGVAALLAAGADVDEQDQYGYTALHYADPESPETVVELLTAGARTDIEDCFGGTPMDSLREKFSDYQIEALLRLARELASQRLAQRADRPRP